jgi:hypothetical protein
MSAELIAIVGMGVTILATTIGGFAWLIARMDRKFERVDADLVEIKVAIARIEGPRPRLVER